MSDKRGRRPKVIILALVGTLLLLATSCWGPVDSWEAQLAARPTTPELVLQAFRDFNYQINDLKVLHGGAEGGLFGSPERSVEFMARGESQGPFTFVRVAQYRSQEEAEELAAAANALNERMHGGFYFVYRRGVTLMYVGVETNSLARGMRNVFLSGAEP